MTELQTTGQIPLLLSLLRLRGGVFSPKSFQSAPSPAHIWPGQQSGVKSRPPPPLFFATLLLHECANSGLSSARGGEGRLSATKATGEGPRLLFSTPQTHEEEEAGRANNTMNSPLSPLTSWRKGGGSYSQTSQGRNRLKPLLPTVACNSRVIANVSLTRTQSNLFFTCFTSLKSKITATYVLEG